MKKPDEKGDERNGERFNKIPIQKFNSTDDFTRSKKNHDEIPKLDKKLKNIDKLETKNVTKNALIE